MTKKNGHFPAVVPESPGSHKINGSKGVDQVYGPAGTIKLEKINKITRLGLVGRSHTAAFQKISIMSYLERWHGTTRSSAWGPPRWVPSGSWVERKLWQTQWWGSKRSLMYWVLVGYGAKPWLRLIRRYHFSLPAQRLQWTSLEVGHGGPSLGAQSVVWRRNH